MNDSTRSSLLALAGGYLIYLAWGLYADMRDGKTEMAPALNIAAIALFTIGGIAVIVYASRMWLLSRRAEKDGKKNREEDDTQGLK